MRTEIVLFWGSKIIINLSNRQTPEPDPGTLTSKTECSMAMRRHWKHGRKHWKVHPGSLPYYILLWVIQLIRGCGSTTEYLLKVNNNYTQTRHSYSPVSSHVDFILFYWPWRFFNIAIIYTDETYMWNNSF